MHALYLLEQRGNHRYMLYTRDGRILEAERERDGFVLLEERKREEGESLVAVRTYVVLTHILIGGEEKKRSCSCQRLMSLSPSTSRLGVTRIDDGPGQGRNGCGCFVES